MLYIFVSMCVPWELNPQPLRCWRNALPLSHRNISLTECQETLSEGQFGKQQSDIYLLCLELNFMHEALVLIPTRIGDFTDFFQDISLDNET